MTRLLVVGGAGMLGHKLWQTASRQVDTWMTLRRPLAASVARGLFDPARTIEGVDADAFDTLERALDVVRPTAVVNCVGIIKQLAAAKDPVASIAINALFPHRLARACAARGARLVHISTDCVFAGTRGGYREDETTDATDLYGRTKALGEVVGSGCLTLRTSIVGREIDGASGLVEWFLSRRGGTADGYRRAIFSGLTTLELSRVILRVIEQHPLLTGLYHVAAAPVDKHALLTLLNGVYTAGVTVVPTDEPHIDRSLDGTRFREATAYVAPSWEAMLREMAGDGTPYDAWREGARRTGDDLQR